eukprot:8441405-Pyramimonas_sp.AAC.1
MFIAKLPVWDSDMQCRKQIYFPLMLPHESFAMLYEKDPSTYDVSKTNPADLPSTYRSHVVTREH